MRKRRADRESTTVRPWRGMSLLLAIALIVAACGDSADDTPTTTAPAGAGTTATTQGTVEPAPSDEPVTIRIWFGRENWIPTDAFAAFNEMYPHISVETDVIPLEQATTDFLRAFNAGNAPDIVSIESTERVPLVSAGALRDMSAEFALWAQEDPEVYSTIQDIAWNDGSWDGVPYGVALSSQTAWYAYRTDLFAAAGLDAPETFEDVIAAARALNGDGVNGHCIVLSRNRGTRAEFGQHFMAMGGQFDNGVPILDSDAGRYLVEFLRTITGEGLITQESYAWGSGDMRGAFISGNCAMAEGSPNVLPSWARDQPWGEFWGVVPTPYRADAPGEFQQGIASWGWYVSQATEHPYEASLVLRYLATPEFLCEVHYRYIPTSSDACWNSPGLFEVQPWVDDALIANVQGAVGIPANPRGLEMNEIVMDFWEEASSNFDESPAEITARYQQLLDEFR